MRSRLPRFLAALSAVVLAGTAFQAVTTSESAPGGAAASTAVAGTAAISASAVTGASGLTAAQTRVRSRLSARAARTAKAVDGTVTGLVVDTTNGRTVWSRGATRPMLPASTTKIGTAIAALEVLAPKARFTTTVVRTGARKVVLVGGGDPSLSRADLERLASATAKKLRSVKVGRVAVAYDDTLFGTPSRARGWPSSYYPGDIAPVRGLGIDGRSVMNTGADAAGVYAAGLRRAGIKVTGVARGKSPKGAAALTWTRSATLRRMVARMQEVSDNDYAEAMLRHVALGTGAKPTWGNALREQRRILTDMGVPLGGVVLRDGSGLSRQNRIPARTLVALVRAAGADRRLVSAVDSLPIAGKTGTLRPALGRFTTAPGKCAAGKLTGKTGQLTGAVALAGEAKGPHGRTYAYAVVINGTPSSTAVKRRLDNLAATITGCW